MVLRIVGGPLQTHLEDAKLDKTVFNHRKYEREPEKKNKGLQNDKGKSFFEKGSCLWIRNIHRAEEK